jgi:hypothetical protein
MALVYEVEKEREADFLVSEVEKENHADLIVFEVEKERLAKSDELWFFCRKRT